MFDCSLVVWGVARISTPAGRVLPVLYGTSAVKFLTNDLVPRLVPLVSRLSCKALANNAETMLVRYSTGSTIVPLALRCSFKAKATIAKTTLARSLPGTTET